MEQDSIIQAAFFAIAGLVGYGKLKERVDAHQKCLEKLGDLPEAVARIDERVKAIHDNMKVKE